MLSSVGPMMATSPTEAAATLRIGVPADLTSLEAVDHLAFCKADCWDPLLWTGMLKSPATRVLVACSSLKAEVVGFAVAEKGGKIMKIAVVPGMQRRGIGAVLLDSTLQLIDKGEFRRTCLCASLHVDPDNTGALRLYERRGFLRDAVVGDYYAPGRPAWRMLRERP